MTTNNTAVAFVRVFNVKQFHRLRNNWIERINFVRIEKKDQNLKEWIGGPSKYELKTRIKKLDWVASSWCRQHDSDGHIEPKARWQA